MFDYVFFDLDNTLLDFAACEAGALSQSLEHFGISMTGEMYRRYSAINDEKWRLLELGEIDRKTLQLSRFSDFFVEFQLSLSPNAFNHVYLEALAQQSALLPGARAVLEELCGQTRLFLVTNGVEQVQISRLEKSGLSPFFENVFNSERIGVQKPDPAFFQACFSQIPGFRAERAVLVGDSLRSDILGANQAGIASCWYNPGGTEAGTEASPDCQVRSLEEIPVALTVLEFEKQFT